MLVAIDTGHGFGCPNASPDGALREYEWADIIAERLLQVLTARGVYAMILTPEIQDTPLRERVRKINEICSVQGAQNTLLVSLHLNAYDAGRWSKARGFSVFVSKRAGRRSKVAAELMMREAEARDLLGNRARITPDEKGCRFSTWFWREDDIYILLKSKCPAILTESGFMTNREDYEYLMSAEGREEIVALHADAICNYIEKYGKR